MTSRSSFSGSFFSPRSSPGPTRRCVIPVPPGAKPGHTLAVQTDVGLFQLAVPAKQLRTFVTELPVPPGCPLTQLTVAWVRVGGAAAQAAAATAAAAQAVETKETSPSPARRPSTQEEAAIDAFYEGEDSDDGADDTAVEVPAAPLRVTVCGFRTTTAAVTEYKVTAARGPAQNGAKGAEGGTAVVGETWHRYSDFVRLHEDLAEAWGEQGEPV